MKNGQISVPVEKEFLEGLLRQALACQHVNLGEWQVQALSGGLEYGTAIQRLSGVADGEGRTRNWSLILKAIQPGVRDADPLGYNYWKREALAYQSGFLQDLPGGLAAPRCYAVIEQPDGSIWIWMEDIQDDRQQPWSIEQYTQVARQLGQFNGAYLAGRSLPDGVWVSHGWLRRYLEHAAPMVEFIRKNPAHPVVRTMLPGIILPMSLAVWYETPRLLEALDRLPQTFCHQDAFIRNLFLRGNQVVAVDWGFAGIAPAGSDLASLVGVAFVLGKFPSSQAKQLDRACFAAYLEGLRQAGWGPDPQQVRKGFTLTMDLRYIFGATIGELLPGLLDEHTRQHWVDGVYTSPSKAGEADPEIAAYYQSIGIEALKSQGLGVVSRTLFRTLVYATRLKSKYGSL